MYQPIAKSIFLGGLMAMISFSATANAGIPNNLPVKFIRFYAQQVGDYVQIRWITDSEYDNDFFTVERSKNMTLWEPLEVVPGSEISPGAGEYEYFDLDPIEGANYYRIRQTDLNGAFDFSHTEKVEVDFFADEIAEVAVAPNPLPGSSLSFNVNGPTSLVGATVKLIDITGKEVKTTIEINDTELNVTPLNRMSGFYFLIIRKGEQAIVKKIKFE